jgi:hypothetical protein
MKSYLFLCVILAIAANGSAFAADNLVCDPPAKDLGGSTPVLTGPHTIWREVRAGATQTLCVPILKDTEVQSLQCAREIIEAPRKMHGYRCAIGESCFGGGTFVMVQRQNMSATMDQICTTFGSQFPRTQSAGFGYKDVKPSNQRTR